MSTSSATPVRPASPPPHPLCERLECMAAADEALHAAGLATAAAREAYRSHHARLHAALAPVSDDRWEGHRYPTCALALSFQEATALYRHAQAQMEQGEGSGPLEPLPDGLLDSDCAADGSGKVAPCVAIASPAPSAPKKNASTVPSAFTAASSNSPDSALSSLLDRMSTALSSPAFASRGCTARVDGVSTRDAVTSGRFRRTFLEALVRVHMEVEDVERARTPNGVALVVESCISRAMQLHTAQEVVDMISASSDARRQLRLALSFGRELFASSIVLTQFQPELVMHPSAHFRCLVAEGRLAALSQRSASLFHDQLAEHSDRILAAVADWTSKVEITDEMGGTVTGPGPGPGPGTVARRCVLDLVVLGPPIIAAREENECTASPVQTRSPEAAALTRKPPRAGSHDLSPSDSDAEDESGAQMPAERPAPPFPYPYDIRLLHVRTAGPPTSLGLYDWNEIKIGPSPPVVECRILPVPRPDVLQSIPPLWREFVERECRPRSKWKALLALVRDLPLSIFVTMLVLMILLIGVSLRPFHPSALTIFLGAAALLPLLLCRAAPRPSVSSASSCPSESPSPSPSPPPTNSESSSSPLCEHRVLLSTPNALIAGIRALDLSPLVRVELGGGVRVPSALVDRLQPDTGHLTAGRRLVVNVVCGPRLVLRLARVAAGSERWRPVGALGGPQILALLHPHERYNFIVQTHTGGDGKKKGKNNAAAAAADTVPSCGRLVLSHVGSGLGGGLYAKHALLAELRPVSFAGELWLDENQIVHVNNSSGTYRPADALLPHVEKFLTRALRVRVHAHQRPDKDTQ